MTDLTTPPLVLRRQVDVISSAAVGVFPRALAFSHVRQQIRQRNRRAVCNDQVAFPVLPAPPTVPASQAHDRVRKGVEQDRVGLGHDRYLAGHPARFQRDAGGSNITAKPDASAVLLNF